MDDELDQLLDSALTDFDENKNEAKKGVIVESTLTAATSAPSTTASSETNSSRSTVIIEDTNIIAEEEPGERAKSIRRDFQRRQSQGVVETIPRCAEHAQERRAESNARLRKDDVTTNDRRPRRRR